MFRIMLYHIILTANNVITSQNNAIPCHKSGNNAQNNAIPCQTD